jgi:hypothetical protein
MNIHSLLQLKAGRNVALLAIAAGLAFATAAQPTGNPKGSAPPPTSDAQKAPASRAPTAGFGDSGKIVTDQETVKSRSQTTNPPGNAGQSGPAPGKTPNRSNSGAGAQGAGATAKPPPQ